MIIFEGKLYLKYTPKDKQVKEEEKKAEKEEEKDPSITKSS
jgi:hypothetical protein